MARVHAAQLRVTEQIRRPRRHAVGVLVGHHVGLLVEQKLSACDPYDVVNATERGGDVMGQPITLANIVLKT